MCRQCELKPVYEFTNKRKLCRTCYIRWFEKKVLYTIRKYSMLKNGDVVLYKKENYPLGTQGCTPKNIPKNIFTRGIVLEEVLKMLAKNRDLKITNKGKYNKLALPTTTDLIAYEILDKVINGKVKDLSEFNPSQKKIISPLFLFLDAEVELYAKIRGLKFGRNNKKLGSLQSREQLIATSQVRGKNLNSGINDNNLNLTKISKFIDEIEKKHPEVKRAILNNYLNFF